MNKITLKELKNLVHVGAATDISSWSEDKVCELKHARVIAYHCDKLGRFSKLIKTEDDNKLYVVIKSSVSFLFD